MISYFLQDLESSQVYKASETPQSSFVLHHKVAAFTWDGWVMLYCVHSNKHVSPLRRSRQTRTVSVVLLVVWFSLSLGAMLLSFNTSPGMETNSASGTPNLMLMECVVSSHVRFYTPLQNLESQLPKYKGHLSCERRSRASINS